MFSSVRRVTLLAALSLVAVLAVGVAAAGAHGGPGRGSKGPGASALVNEAAKDNLRYAMALSRTRAVASNLGITTTKLNSGFRSAREALIIRRIDQAVAAGDLEADEAAELKAELDEEDLPGYKAGGPGGFGFGGHGDGGPRGARGGRGE